MDRLDRTLEEFVDDGRLTAELAAEMSREYHTHHVDIRQRLAELAGYAGAALAIVGLIVIGSQIWTDVAQVVQAGLAAAMSAALILGAWLVVRSAPALGDHPVKSRLAQVMGEAGAVLALLAVLVAFQHPELGYDEAWPWKMTLAASVALLISFVVSRWAPGFITTIGTAVFVMMAGLNALGAVLEPPQGPGPTEMFMIVVGAFAALVAYRWFPPPVLTRALGIFAWLQGIMALLLAEEGYQDPADGWRWVGRAAAVVLVVLGTWLFVRGGDWPWAVGAVVGVGLLAGVWSSQALNAGIALVVTGLVLILAAVLLALWRRAGERATLPPDAAQS